MEEKRIYYVGIDHGNHLMKTSNHVFENGVERQAVKPRQGKRPRNIRTLWNGQVSKIKI